MQNEICKNIADVLLQRVSEKNCYYCMGVGRITAKVHSTSAKSPFGLGGVAVLVVVLSPLS